MQQYSLITSIYQDIQMLKNSVDCNARLVRQLENELSDRCVIYIDVLQNRLTPPLRIKYNKMVWPFDASQHLSLFLEWLSKPKIKKQLPASFNTPLDIQPEEYSFSQAPDDQ